jgi:hypothetical protein
MTLEEIKTKYDEGQGVSSVLNLLRYEVYKGDIAKALKKLRSWKNEQQIQDKN